MLYDTFIARDASKVNKPNKANTTNTVISAYDAARPTAIKSLGYNDAICTHLKFYFKTVSVTYKS